jgi:serine/threonine protein phosphatase 1
MKATSLVSNARRLYVVGDIHGRADLLDRMIEEIACDLARAPIAEALTVTIGDYIDRGPNSRLVIDRLAHNPFPTGFIALKGNHEVLLETFLRDPSVAEHWRHLGGIETLHSYGVDPGPLMRGQNFAAAAEALREALSGTHSEFLASLHISLTAGEYFFCHAGVRPGVLLEQQRENDLLWIRDEFLTSSLDFGKIVVHGHSPVEEPDLRPNRINVDTGAFITGRLSCAVIEGGRVRFLTANL